MVVVASKKIDYSIWKTKNRAREQREFRLVTHPKSQDCSGEAVPQRGRECEISTDAQIDEIQGRVLLQCQNDALRLESKAQEHNHFACFIAATGDTADRERKERRQRQLTVYASEGNALMQNL